MRRGNAEPGVIDRSDHIVERLGRSKIHIRWCAVAIGQSEMEDVLRRALTFEPF